jgi:hypothetical protein
LILVALVAPSTANADKLSFLCSWDQETPITIAVDTKDMTASRSDGGHAYHVVKVSKWGVWLSVDDPMNVAGLAVQMIVRTEALGDKKAGGRWVDVVMAITGAVSPIDGGLCWEQ